MHLLQHGRRQDHAADLRKHRSDFHLPAIRHTRRRSHPAHGAANPGRASERQGARQSQHVGKSFDGSVQRLLQQDALCGDQFVLLDAVFQRHRHHDAGTRLGEEPEDGALVDRGDGPV